MDLQFFTQSDILHRFTTFHVKRGPCYSLPGQNKEQTKIVLFHMIYFKNFSYSFFVINKKVINKKILRNILYS